MTNLEVTASCINDVAGAQESVAFARKIVFVSAGTFMLARANRSSQLTLSFQVGPRLMIARFQPSRR